MLIVLLITDSIKPLEINNLAEIKAGRLAILGEEHQHYLKQEYKDFPLANLDQTMESLINELKNLRNVNEIAQ